MIQLSFSPLGYSLFFFDFPPVGDAAVTARRPAIKACSLDEDVSTADGRSCLCQPVGGTVRCRNVCSQAFDVVKFVAAVEHLVVALLLQCRGWKHEIFSVCMGDMCIVLEQVLEGVAVGQLFHGGIVILAEQAHDVTINVAVCVTIDLHIFAGTGALGRFCSTETDSVATSDGNLILGRHRQPIATVSAILKVDIIGHENGAALFVVALEG